MKQKTREEVKEINSRKKFLGGHKDKVKMCQKVGAKFWREAYNCLCRTCQGRIIKNPTLPFNEYCSECKISLNKLAEEKGLRVR